MEKVFVYGTLMKGHGNDRLLKDSNFIGKAKLDGYGLYCVTPYYPGIIRKNKSAVRGEVYEVDSATLKRLDSLECAGTLYSRKQELCTMEDGSLQQVYFYNWLGDIDEKDYVPVEFTPWDTDVLSHAKSGIGKEYFYLFAYGRYCNVREIRKLMKEAVIDKEEEIIGVGIYNNHRLAFTRKKSNGHGALDIIPSEGDYALGVIYRMPVEILPNLDRKEGRPSCYDREAIQVTCGERTITAQAYFVVDKHQEEVMPDEEYYSTVLQGMMDRYPYSFINKYLIEHCNNKFALNKALLQDQPLYYDNHPSWREGKGIEFNKSIDSHLCNLLNMIIKHLGNDNRVVDAIKPTPEMFRILVKIVDMEFRGVLDYGHLIPRGLTNTLASEFQRLTGLVTPKLPEY